MDPLFETAKQLMDASDGTFLLSQSFSYDDDTETAIERACKRLGLKRAILEECDDGERRVQEFQPEGNAEKVWLLSLH